MKHRKTGNVEEKFTEELLLRLLNYNDHNRTNKGEPLFTITDKQGRAIEGDEAKGWVLYKTIDRSPGVLLTYLDKKGKIFLKNLPWLEMRHRKQQGKRKPLYVRKGSKTIQKVSAFRIKRDEESYKMLLLQYLEQGREREFFNSQFHNEYMKKNYILSRFVMLVRGANTKEKDVKIFEQHIADIEVDYFIEFAEKYPSSLRRFLKDEIAFTKVTSALLTACYERGFSAPETSAAISIAEQYAKLEGDNVNGLVEAMNGYRVAFGESDERLSTLMEQIRRERTKRLSERHKQQKAEEVVNQKKKVYGLRPHRLNADARIKDFPGNNPTVNDEIMRDLFIYSSDL